MKCACRSLACFFNATTSSGTASLLAALVDRVGIEPGFAKLRRQAEQAFTESEARRQSKFKELTTGDSTLVSFLPAQRVGKNGG